MTIDWGLPLPLESRIDFPDLLTSNGLAIWIEGNATPLLSKLGYFQIEALIEGEFFKLRPERLDAGKNLIVVPYQAYKLSIIPLPNILTVYPSLTVKIAQINKGIMSINYQNVDRVTGGVVNTPVAGAIASFQILPTDANRHSGTIYNRTNRNLWVSWGTAAATTADLLVPAGSNLVIPEDYTGAVQGISAAGVTGNILSQTVSFI
jgi:hypothetical protein